MLLISGYALYSRIIRLVFSLTCSLHKDDLATGYLYLCREKLKKKTKKN